MNNLEKEELDSPLLITETGEIKGVKEENFGVAKKKKSTRGKTKPKNYRTITINRFAAPGLRRRRKFRELRNSRRHRTIDARPPTTADIVIGVGMLFLKN